MEEFVANFCCSTKTTKVSATILLLNNAVSTHRGMMKDGKMGFRLVDTSKSPPNKEGGFIMTVMDADALTIALQTYAYASCSHKHTHAEVEAQVKS